MTSVLYRKYRPKNFDEVIGQEVIVKTLKNALIQNQIAGSYLLTGPRGTGKTTLARIFATVLNCQKRAGAARCGSCAHCKAVDQEQSLDIIEIDAASYTGVDNIRSLRDTMTNTPLLGGHKVFIIDEVHMLSIGAFNALLKIMEEPPAHVVFILATTELHKVPKTIISRCQRFDLRKLTSLEIIQKLTLISKLEKIKIDAEALTIIARASGGALRDAESLLTQLITLTEGKLTGTNVREALGMSDSSTLYALLQSFAKGDSKEVLRITQSLEQAGKECIRISEELVSLLRALLLFSVTREFSLAPLSLLSKEEQTLVAELSPQFTRDSLCALIEALDKVVRESRGNIFGFLSLEIALIKNIPLADLTLTETGKPEEPHANPAGPRDSSEKKEPALKQAPKKTPTNTNPATQTNHSLEVIEQKWQAIISAVQKLNASLSGALQNARPVSLENDRLAIAVKYKFHKERLETPEHRLTLEEAFATILGSNLSLSIVESNQKKVPEKSTAETSPLVSDALALLGGQVL
jgi:DNA polymerase-3 subunit gamma/tau